MPKKFVTADPQISSGGGATSGLYLEMGRKNHKNVLNSPLCFHCTARHISNIFLHHIFPQFDREKSVQFPGPSGKKIINIKLNITTSFD